MDMLIGGRWQSAASGRTEDIASPFDGAAAGTVPVADVADVRTALDLAERGAVTWRRTPAHERMRIMLRAAELADERAEQIGQLISAESGKVITEARGDALVSDPRVRKVSFTGSTATGQHITQVAGIKKLSLELGSSCPVIILPDADIELAASAVAAGGFINAGQVCISVQRVITHQDIGADFLDALVPKVEAIRTGDPRAEHTTMGTLITAAEAERVEQSIREAVAGGAKLLTGGERDGAIVSPAVVAGVDPGSPLSQDELFGPAVAVSSAQDWASAIEQANGTAYGLGAGLFTSDVSGAVRAMREIDAGTVHINWTPLWRADLMPYGGLKASGIGQEGPRSAVAEMTDVKTVVLHGRPR